MLTASSFLLALGLIIVIGGGATAWLRMVQCARFEREEGLKLLSAMRWREFSRLVVDGLGSLGFTPEAAEDAAERGQDSVLHLQRDGAPWLLACKQGTNYRITPTMVDDMADAIRFHGSKGGVIATTGTVQGEARRRANGRVELIDGEALWPLVREQLTPGVRSELGENARKAVGRRGLIAWAGAAVLGLVIALALPAGEDAPDTTTTKAQPIARAASPTASASPAPTVAAAPVSEDEQRDEVIRMVSTLPGVERAMWSTRSTLMVYLVGENTDPVDDICSVVERYDALRTSRLHLQPPSGSRRPARFLQCRTY